MGDEEGSVRVGQLQAHENNNVRLALNAVNPVLPSKIRAAKKRAERRKTN